VAFEISDEGAGIVPSGLEDPDAFLNGGLSVALVVGRVDGGEEGDVNALEVQPRR
jgi:hypothetical protein